MGTRAFVFRTCAGIKRYVNISSSLTRGSQEALIFGKLFKSCLTTSLFLGSGLTVYQAATS